MPVAWSDTTLAVMQAVDITVVVLVGPTACSNMHCNGDVEPGNVIQQTQVLNP